MCASLFSVCAFSENGFLVLSVILWFLVLLLVSVWFQFSTNLCVFPASAQQTCAHDKMRHFVCGKHDMFTLGQSSRSMVVGGPTVFCKSNSNDNFVSRQ